VVDALLDDEVSTDRQLQCGEERAGERWERTDDDDRAVGRRQYDLVHRTEVLQNVIRLANHLLAALCRPRPGRAPLEQPNPAAALQPGEALARGRLRHLQLPRRCPDRPRAGQRQHQPQVRHRRH
jgi:hypothetical protein